MKLLHTIASAFKTPNPNGAYVLVPHSVVEETIARDNCLNATECLRAATDKALEQISAAQL